MADGLTIVFAEAKHVDLAVDLLNAQLVEHDICTPLDALREVTRAVVDEPRHGFMLLAMMDGNAAGVAFAAAHLSAEHGGVIGWLEELYVAPVFRGRGIGAALLDRVSSNARSLGWRGVELEVVAGHERAAALYLRQEFTPLPRARYSRIFS